MYKLPLWSFIFYSVDVVLSAFHVDEQQLFWGSVLDMLQILPFFMPLPIMLAMLRYRYFLRFVLIGEDIDSLIERDSAPG